MILFIIGLFCFLLVVGFFVAGGDNALAFAGGSMIFLGAVAFVGFVLVVLYAILTSH